jgi:hypothetical protein
MEREHEEGGVVLDERDEKIKEAVYRRAVPGYSQCEWVNSAADPPIACEELTDIGTWFRFKIVKYCPKHRMMIIDVAKATGERIRSYPV